MADRYFVPNLLENDLCALVGGELRHAAQVMRLEPGGKIVVFDGRGHEADTEIVSMTKSRATLRIVDRRNDPPEAGAEIVLATAIPKADRFRWLAEKATELGVERLIPLRTARSVVHPRDGKIERMRLAVIEACKQSGRNRLMQIEPPMNWERFVAAVVPSGSAFIADPHGEPLSNVADCHVGRKLIVLAVGPEGGLTKSELQQAAAAGAKGVSLGPRILRIETAALALAAVFALQRPSLRSVAWPNWPRS